MYENNRTNLLLATDAYKGSHFKLYPSGTEALRFYLAPRKPFAPDLTEFIFFGLTGFIHDFLKQPITTDDIAAAREIWDRFNVGGTPYPFPFDAFEKLVAEKDGRPPVNIYGMPEGRAGNRYNEPVAMVECLDPDYLFLPGMLETALQRDVWYGSTVATLSRNVRVYLEGLYRDTVEADDYWTIDYRLHDFGARGVSSAQGAANGGLAHLINFKGTDTMEAAARGRELYGMPADELAASIPAAEHSTVTSFGADFAAEKEALHRMIDAFGEGPMFAFVSDSYDHKRFVAQAWGDPEIIARIRAKGAMPVVRPDSGDPVEMVLYALESLGKSWGNRVNAKGYKVLDGIAVIQGDGMDHGKIVELYQAIVAAGWSPQNLAVGMGGGLLQKVNRDTMSWSMKLYQIRREGRWYDVQKKPATMTAKRGWDPAGGLNTRDWVTYYMGDERNATYPELPAYVPDFGAVRDRAAPGLLNRKEAV